MQDFKKLDVWKRSHEFTLTVYRLTSTFPQSETYGLTSQLRRAASSVPANVPANIAEGCGRDSPLDFARFLDVAFGSASELEYHLLLARDLGLLQPEAYEHAQVEVTGTEKNADHAHKKGQTCSISEKASSHRTSNVNEY